MKPQTVLLSKLCLIFVIFGLTIGFLCWQFSARAAFDQSDKNSNDLSNYDIRTDEAAKQTIANFIEQSGQNASAIEQKRARTIAAENDLRSKTPNLVVEYNTDLRIPEVIGTDFNRGATALTAPSGGKRARIFRDFLKQTNALVGLSDAQIDALDATADYTNPDGNLSFVHFEQKLNGVPVFRGEVKAGFSKRGEIIRVINNLAPNVSETSVSNDFGNAETAVKAAARHLGLETNEADLKRVEAASDNLKITFERGQFNDTPTAEKMYFPIENAVVRTAWRVYLPTKTESFYVIVDARTGTLLWRKNLTESQTQTATYNVYGNATSLMKTADSPSPFSPGCDAPTNCPQPPAVARQSFTLIGNEPPYTFNNLGWIPDGENRTIGNNAEAGIDRDGMQGIDPNGWAFGNPNRNFVYSYNPAPGNPTPGEEPLPTPPQPYPPSAFQQGSITHAFYTVNRWHDETYRLGFTEQARNFQNDNFNRGGAGNDSILVEVQDSSGTNSANMSTQADGTRPRVQMYIWTGPTPDRDGALDSQVVVHELTHGLSNRLHGNVSGLSTNMSRGMGEGWSDFYALAMLSEPTDNPLGTHAVGGYITYQITSGFESNYYYGIRRFPTAIKAAVGPNGLPHNPLTFRYLNANCNTLIGTTNFNPNSAFPRGPIGTTTCDQIHNIGEVWNVALWEVRNQLIELRGAAEGNRRALQYVTDGMKLSPLSPTMLQSRDSILISSQVSDAADVCAVWRGFAIRGMGVSASIQNAGSGANNTAVTEAFDIPQACRRTTRADYDGDRKSDVSVFRPSEGNWYLNNSTNGFGVVRWGISTDKLVPGDYDGDGKTDFAIFRANNDGNQPDFYILNSSNFTVGGYSWGVSGDIPIIEDYDGDSKDDVAIYRSSDGYAYVINSSGGILVRGLFLAGSPVTGDFDGDGRADFASRGLVTWFIYPSTANYVYNSYIFGEADDKAVHGDFDGDGKDDIAVFRPSNGNWIIRNSSGGTTYAQFGISTDVPVPADYDGDGRTDIAIYRNGVWWINRSRDGLLVTNFGLSDDVPIQNRYLP